MRKFWLLGLVLLACSAPKDESLTGTWSSDFGVMELTQDGDRITGTYNRGLGEIEGELRGDTVFFHWREADREGTGYWVVADRGRQLVGKFRVGEKGPWMGYWRAKRQEKK